MPFIIVLLLLCCLQAVKSDDLETQAEKIAGEIKSTNTWDAYRALLQTQRKAQMDAMKQLLGMTFAEKQYDMLNVITKKLIEILAESKTALTTAKFSPTDPFPADEDVRDSLSKLIQNSLLYADLALRFPTFLHLNFDKNKKLHPLIQWCFQFVEDTGVTKGTSAAKTIHLASQELNIKEREENYTNPFSEEAELKLSDVVKEELKKKKKPKQKRGPKLSGQKVEL